MTTNPTKLGRKLGAPPSTASSTPLAARIAGGRRGEDDVDLGPFLGRARVELVGELARQEIEAAVYRAMRARDMELTVLTAERFEAERAVRTLAEAVKERNAEGALVPFGTLEEWQALDTDVVTRAWDAYGDVRENLDPFAVAMTLTERQMIEVAIQKKDAALLRTFGAAKLSDWLATTAELRSTSPIQKSSSSDSSPAGQPTHEVAADPS